MVEFNPYAYETHEDPYPIYRALREEAPLYRNDELDFWALSRHADVRAAFRDPDHLSNAQGVSLDRISHEHAEMAMSFLAMDPPRHTHMRALVSRGFTPRRVSEFEPRVRELAVQSLEKFVESGRCEFVDDFAGRLPMDVISEMLGVPEADRDTLRHWADTIVHREDGMTDVPKAGIDASIETIKYFVELVKDREQTRREDLPSALLDAEIDGERLRPFEVVAFMHLMVIAGNETTTKLLANAMYWLWRHPGERDKVDADPARAIPLWVEETLRFDNSTQALARTVRDGVTFQGERLPDGAKVLLLVGSANRDERVFPAPDRFDLDRNTSSMLSFGQGTHFCVGASLARLEARVALEEVWPRLRSFEIDAAGAERVHSSNVRGFAKLPMEFEPGPRP